MAELNITDWNTFLNTQIQQHEQLTEQLTHIQYLVDFTASSDLKNPDPLHLNAQLIAIETSLKEAENLNQDLQERLLVHAEHRTQKGA